VGSFVTGLLTFLGGMFIGWFSQHRRARRSARRHL
jgi:hypothetical protein